MQSRHIHCWEWTVPHSPSLEEEPSGSLPFHVYSWIEERWGIKRLMYSKRWENHEFLPVGFYNMNSYLCYSQRTFKASAKSVGHVHLCSFMFHFKLILWPEVLKKFNLCPDSHSCIWLKCFFLFFSIITIYDFPVMSIFTAVTKNK